jgi:hypothetical protein
MHVGRGRNAATVLLESECANIVLELPRAVVGAIGATDPKESHVLA